MTVVDTVSAPETVSPQEAPATPRASLSPSRAADFKTCPLLYRYRSIDRLPERPTGDQARGTLVHAVLERLFDLPAQERTPQRAGELVEPEWTRLAAEHPELSTLFTDPDPDPASGQETGDAARPAEADGGDPAVPARAGDVDARRAEFLRSARELLGGYFQVEDPRRLAPAEREC